MPNLPLLRDRHLCGARRTRAHPRLLPPLLTAGLALACAAREEMSAAGAPAEGELRGVVRSTVAREPEPTPSMAGAPVCRSLNESLPEPAARAAELADRLADAFVYVDGAGAVRQAVPAEAAELVEEGCRFRPRVLGMQAGQTLRIINRDPTVHDVAVEARENEGWIETQPFAGMVSERVLDRPEVMVPVRCELHPWMRAWVGVVPTSHFAVSGAAGEFSIGGLAPGRYRLEAWHESLGRRSLEIAVTAGEVTRVEVVFGAQESHAL